MSQARPERTKKARGRGPVVHLDRTKKAKMIDACLRDHLGRPIEGMRLLDIGGGNGMISQFFADRGNDVFSVDVAEQRNEPDPRVKFQLVDSEDLPFEDSFFDIVLSHHVIEHVGDQGQHLAEIRRVVREGGLCWLGTPNKSSPVMEGHVGNDQVLRFRQMQPLFERHGFRVRPYSVIMMRRPFELYCERSFGRFLPTFLLRWLQPLFPSHSFVLEPAAQDRSAAARQ